MVFLNLIQMKRIQYLTLTLTLFLSQIIFAQSDSSEQHGIKFKIAVNYCSGLNYFGRTDSLKSAGVFPQAEIWFSKNLYASATPVFVNNALQSMEYEGTLMNLGYLHTTDKWITNFYLLKPFYKRSSQLIQSALKAQSGVSVSRLNPVLNLTLGADIKLSDKIDFGTTAGVDHLIRKEFQSHSVLVVDPSFYAYAGTENFSSTYYKKKPGFLFLPGTTEEVNESFTKFNILAYEFSLPVVYAKGNWMVLFTPSYILPQNLLTVSGRPDLSEKGQNIFYATIGIKYSF
jgi:hypothetical protein